MDDDTLFRPAEVDGFTHESPLRGFTDFNVTGCYAIGKGFRPSLHHLPAYLDAMHRKEGWSLVQLLLSTTGGDPTIIFHKLTDPVMPEIRKKAAKGPPASDLGAPHDVPLLIKVRSPFREVESSGIFRDGKWYIITRMDGDKITSQHMIGNPIAWRERPQHDWTPATAGVEPEDRDYPQDDPRSKTLEAFRRRCGDEDDPINPKHYNGTACAEIGERLTGNSYQVLKYNWRLGEKGPATVDLGKALWYLDREIALAEIGFVPSRMGLPDYHWFDKRICQAGDHAKSVARILISWNRYGNVESLKGLRKNLQRTLDGLNDNEPEHGRGLAL
jgi:hypothetical protein